MGQRGPGAKPTKKTALPTAGKRARKPRWQWRGATVPQPRPGQVVHTAMEWSPDMPRRLSKREWRQYRAGRDAAFAELFAGLGIRGAVLEV